VAGSVPGCGRGGVTLGVPPKAAERRFWQIVLNVAALIVQ
jgi:hypothetical protein